MAPKNCAHDRPPRSSRRPTRRARRSASRSGRASPSKWTKTTKSLCLAISPIKWPVLFSEQPEVGLKSWRANRIEISSASPWKKVNKSIHVLNASTPSASFRASFVTRSNSLFWKQIQMVSSREYVSPVSGNQTMKSHKLLSSICYLQDPHLLREASA